MPESSVLLLISGRSSRNPLSILDFLCRSKRKYGLGVARFSAVFECGCTVKYCKFLLSMVLSRRWNENRR
jgi:hypothetical protein